MDDFKRDLQMRYQQLLFSETVFASVGLPPLVANPWPHILITGYPGTGKTSLARKMLELYHYFGICKRVDRFVEVKRSDLVGAVIGETEKKTAAKIEAARGGMLFVDEAYQLAGTGNDFGPKAIEAIMNEMAPKADPWQSVVFVFAGYGKREEIPSPSAKVVPPTKDAPLDFKDRHTRALEEKESRERKNMEDFLAANDGLARRIGWRIPIPNFTPTDLAQITIDKLKESKRPVAGDVNVAFVANLIAELPWRWCAQRNGGVAELMVTELQQALSATIASVAATLISLTGEEISKKAILSKTHFAMAVQAIRKSIN